MKAGQTIDPLLIGTAGEHVVCADLLMQGYNAFRTDQHCRYDVVLEANGLLLRIQVKTTTHPRRVPQRLTPLSAYAWDVRSYGSKYGRKYGAGDFDMLALVALDTRQVAYLPPSRIATHIYIRVGNDPRPACGLSGRGGRHGKTFAQFTLGVALDELVGAGPKQASLPLPSNGTDVSTIRYLPHDEEPADDETVSELRGHHAAHAKLAVRAA